MRYQSLSISMDGLEHLPMQLLYKAHRLQGKVELLMDHKVFAEGDRDAAEKDVSRQLLQPGL